LPSPSWERLDQELFRKGDFHFFLSSFPNHPTNFSCFGLLTQAPGRIADVGSLFILIGFISISLTRPTLIFQEVGVSFILSQRVYKLIFIMLTNGRITLTMGVVMVGLRDRGEAIRQFIINNVEGHANDIVIVTADEFDISRQAVSVHMKRLVQQKSIIAEGNTRNRIYKLHPLVEVTESFDLLGLEEDRIWRDFVASKLGALPDNVLDIWHYGFTEMLNNAIDHSQGNHAIITIKKTPVSSEIIITDDGIGIFTGICNILELNDERHAVLELSKGKLTTDPGYQFL